MLTIGADPEFWLVNRDTGRPVSAHDLEGALGTKGAPRALDCGGGVQVDGTAVEFNIVPASTAEEFVENMRLALNEVRQLVPYRYAFNFSPVRFYTPAMWEKIPEKAKEIGCDPELHARYAPYVRRHLKKARRARGVGGHLHFGWTTGRNTKDDPQHQFDCKFFAQMCACNIPITVSKLLGNHDEERLRIEYTGYGGFSSYRVKPYGMEYRALSSRWVSRPDTWRPLFNFCKRLFEVSRNMERAARLSDLAVPIDDYKPHTWMR